MKQRYELSATDYDEAMDEADLICEQTHQQNELPIPEFSVIEKNGSFYVCW